MMAWIRMGKRHSRRRPLLRLSHEVRVWPAIRAKRRRMRRENGLRRRGLEAHGFVLHRSGRRCREQAGNESPPAPPPAKSLTRCASLSCQSRTTWEERRRTRPPCALHSYRSNAAHSPNRQRPNPRGWASTMTGMLPRYPASHRRVAASCTGRGFKSGRRRRSSCRVAS